MTHSLYKKYYFFKIETPITLSIFYNQRLFVDKLNIIRNIQMFETFKKVVHFCDEIQYFELLNLYKTVYK